MLPRRSSSDNPEPLRETGTPCRYRVRVPTPARILGLLLLVLAALAVAVPATAVVACVYGGGTASVTLAQGDSATIVRSGAAIHVNGSACDTATVNNTDLIDVVATGVPTEVAIDLTGGQFAPGATDEGDGSSEIEFAVTFPSGSPTLRIVGTGGIDTIVVGASGINLNGAETTGVDADVTLTGLSAIVVNGGSGADVLSVAGGSGTGDPSAATLRGTAGADTLFGGKGGSTFDGGDGSDRLDYAAATRLTLADLGTGEVTHKGGAVDSVSSIQILDGSPGNDKIVGGTKDEQLRGAAGDDTISGRRGADTVVGGRGRDTASFADRDGVTVDLRKGTTKHAGGDTLEGIEDVRGSSSEDVIHGNNAPNALYGRGGADLIFGHGKDDVIRSGVGNDELSGHNGDDILRAGRGNDELNGGNDDDLCKGGPGADSFVYCENYPTRGSRPFVEAAPGG